MYEDNQQPRFIILNIINKVQRLSKAISYNRNIISENKVYLYIKYIDIHEVSRVHLM